ncbi:MAG: PIN domain-containing protein [Candidatus Parvarchaeota archaeon]|jgi:hypothetical protein|nr:PIN domain-containing protein [Candidatus Parvarchaeota archaeon]MCL5420171.1 PIN domain-containing protein [Candidatus Parvarchaeota archaeon]
MNVLLDTSVIIEQLKGSEDVNRFITTNESNNISVLSIYETLVGIKDKAKRIRVKQFFESFPLLEFSAMDAVKAAEIHEILALKGSVINTMDVLLAAQASDRGLTVLTKDKDFIKIRDIAGINSVIIS